MKSLIIPLIYFFFVACGAHTLTSTLSEMTEKDCINSNNPYSSACLYLSSKKK